MTFAKLTEIKDRLRPALTYRYNNQGVPVAVEVQEEIIADDECYTQIKMYVAEVQSAAHKFGRRRTTENLEGLLNASDSLSAFVMDICSSPTAG